MSLLPAVSLERNPRSSSRAGRAKLLEAPSPSTGLDSRFVLERRIGAGPSGIVYRALDLSRGERVALKILHPRESHGPQFAIRFRELYRSLITIEHRNLAAIYDYGLLDGRYYVAAELVEGSDLAGWMTKEGRPAPRRAARLAHEISLALEAVHQRGWVHRGLKPHNVLLTAEGQVKLTDVGLAAAFSDSGLSKTRQLLSAVRYFSPEQARGEVAGLASDTYSLGVLLFEMLTGRPPFDTSDVWDLVRQHGWKNPPSPRSLCPDVPESLSQIVQRALRKSPAARFASAHDMAAALECVQSDTREPSIVTLGGIPPDPQGDRRARKSLRPAVSRPQGRLRTLFLGLAIGGQYVASFAVALAAFLALSRALGASTPQNGPAAMMEAADLGVSPPEKFIGSQAWASELLDPARTAASDLAGRPAGGALAGPPGPTESSPVAMLETQGADAEQAGGGERSPSMAKEAPPATPTPTAGSSVPPTSGAVGSPPAPSESSPPIATPTPVSQTPELQAPGGVQDQEGDDEEDERWRYGEDQDWDHENDAEESAIEFWGLVERMDGSRWRVAGREVMIAPETEIEGRIVVGSHVRVEAVASGDGTWLALEIEREDDGGDWDEEDD